MTGSNTQTRPTRLVLATETLSFVAESELPLVSLPHEDEDFIPLPCATFAVRIHLCEGHHSCVPKHMRHRIFGRDGVGCIAGFVRMTARHQLFLRVRIEVNFSSARETIDYNHRSESMDSVSTALDWTSLRGRKQSS